MKANKFIALISLILCFTSCKKEETRPTIQAPFVGLSLKINGVIFNDYEIVEATMVPNVLTSIFAIDSAETNSIAISFGKTEIGTYDFGIGNSGATYKKYDANGFATIYDAVDGKIVITKYDLVNHLLSGTFVMTAINDLSGEVVKINDGVINDIPIVQ